MMRTAITLSLAAFADYGDFFKEKPWRFGVSLGNSNRSGDDTHNSYGEMASERG